jgi:hypothetical protein
MCESRAIRECFLSRMFIVTALVLPLAPVLLGSPALGEVQRIELPNPYSDFAMHPDTGDLMAVSTPEGLALLFREKDLQAGKTEPAASIQVGARPSSVIYKRFGKEEFFAVVCADDPNMYLIDPAEGKIMHKIPLEGNGCSQVASSLNPEDPFLYYCYRAERDISTGVVNLRDKKSKGWIKDRAMEIAVSAHGDTMYMRGPWAGNGFDTLQLSNTHADERPEFVEFFNRSKPNTRCMPDGVSRFTASGTKLFSRGLETEEAEFDFMPQSFFQKYPLLIGVPTNVPYAQPEKTQSMVLTAASYNSFQPVGKKVSVIFNKMAAETPPPKAGAPLVELARIEKQLRLFADDARARVVVARWNHVFFVPLAEFELPDEPFLVAELVGSKDLPIGQKSVLKLELADPKLNFEFGALSGGMEISGNQLIWQPRPDQVGPHEINVTLKHGELKRVVPFDLNVHYPHEELPISPMGWTVDLAAQQMLLWEGWDPSDATPPWFKKHQPPAPTYRVVLWDMKAHKILAEGKHSMPILKGVLTGGHAILLLGKESMRRCEVFKRDSLEPEKSLTDATPIVLAAATPIINIDVADKLIALQTQNGSEIYDTETFRKASVSVSDEQPLRIIPSPFMKQGIVQRGLLLDNDLRPLLVFQEKTLPKLEGTDEKWQPLFQPLASRQVPPHLMVSTMRSPGGEPPLSHVSMPDGKTIVLLKLEQRNLRPSDPSRTDRIERKLLLNMVGEVNTQQELFKVIGRLNVAPRAIRSQLRLGQGEVLATFNNRLYRWPVPPAVAKIEGQPKASLEWTLHQSGFALSGTGKTVLKHAFAGGTPPVKFSLESAYKCINIDELSGEVTIDESAMLPEAEQALIQWVVKGAADQVSCMEVLRGRAAEMVARAEDILGRKARGIPIAIPIRVAITDHQSAAKKLQYFVLAEIPAAPVFEKLRKLDEARASSSLAGAAQALGHPETPAADKVKGAEPAPDVAQLNKRIKDLEQQLETTTQLLNATLKKLKEKEGK